jgi:hypothetical protein
MGFVRRTAVFVRDRLPPVVPDILRTAQAEAQHAERLTNLYSCNAVIFVFHCYCNTLCNNTLGHMHVRVYLALIQMCNRIAILFCTHCSCYNLFYDEKQDYDEHGLTIIVIVETIWEIITIITTIFK